MTDEHIAIRWLLTTLTGVLARTSVRDADEAISFAEKVLAAAPIDETGGKKCPQ